MGHSTVKVCEMKRQNAAEGPSLPKGWAMMPKTFGDCLPWLLQEKKPCPFIRCRHHGWMDLTATGSMHLNYPGWEPHELSPEQSCTLLMATIEGEHTLDEVSKTQNCTKERIRQIEEEAMKKARRMQA